MEYLIFLYLLDLVKRQREGKCLNGNGMSKLKVLMSMCGIQLTTKKNMYILVNFYRNNSDPIVI